MHIILQVSTQKTGVLEEAMAAAAAHGITVKPAERAMTGNQVWEVLAAFREAGFIAGIREGEFIIAEGQAPRVYVMAYTDKYLNQIPFFTRVWFNKEAAIAAYGKAVEWAKQNTEEHGHGYHDIELSEEVDLGDGGEALGFNLASFSASHQDYRAPTAEEVKAHEARMAKHQGDLDATVAALEAKMPNVRFTVYSNGPGGGSTYFTAYDGEDRIGEVQVNSLLFEDETPTQARGSIVRQMMDDIRVKKAAIGRLRGLAEQAVKQLPGDFKVKFVYAGHAQAHIEATGPGIIQAWAQFNTDYYAKLGDAEVVKDIAEQLKERLGLPHLQTGGK